MPKERSNGNLLAVREAVPTTISKYCAPKIAREGDYPSNPFSSSPDDSPCSPPIRDSSVAAWQSGVRRRGGELLRQHQAALRGALLQVPYRCGEERIATGPGGTREERRRIGPARDRAWR